MQLSQTLGHAPGRRYSLVISRVLRRKVRLDLRFWRRDAGTVYEVLRGDACAGGRRQPDALAA
ncbi:MAG: hypothetical protein ACRYHQ_38720 [Janthinobacterium lividum]